MPFLVGALLVSAFTLELQGKLKSLKYKLLVDGGMLMKALVAMYYTVELGASGVSNVICSD